MRHTPYGLRMRASVDRRRLATLRGIDADASSALAWTLSSTLAGLAGVLAVPTLGLDSTAFTVMLFVSATAAVFGRLRSIPVTFAAGLGLGVVQNLVAGYADFAEDVTGLRTAVPVILLFAGLVVLNRSRDRVAGSAAEDAPPPTTWPTCRCGGGDCPGPCPSSPCSSGRSPARRTTSTWAWWRRGWSSR
nr:hypothetical protein GCM10020093_101540 [Planobispora longispora]